MIKWSHSLQTADYVEGLSAISPYINDIQRRLLVAQYHAPNRQVTSSQLARLARVDGGFRVVNAQYGRLGRMFCDQTGARPDIRQNGGHREKERLWSVWSTGWKSSDGFVWQMLPPVAEALEILGWGSPEAAPLPEEISVSPKMSEGGVCRIVINAYERNPVARARCIAHYGSVCLVCGFDFGAVYGQLANGFIHVHHVKPLSEIGTEYEVDAIADLRPVCPNCHAVIHMGGVTRTIEEVQMLITASGMPGKPTTLIGNAFAPSRI